jgi:hypothetical protein
MTSTNKVVLGAAALSLALTAGIASITNAAPEAETDEGRRPRFDRRFEGDHREKFEAVKEAIENGDYASWARAMDSHPNADEIVTEENFALIQQAHKLREDGDLEGAKALLEEAGLKIHPRHHRRGPSPEIRQAIENRDYQAWAEGMKNHPNADQFINQETFSQVLRVHELMQAGDKEAARDILQELGLGKHRRR